MLTTSSFFHGGFGIRTAGIDWCKDINYYFTHPFFPRMSLARLLLCVLLIVSALLIFRQRNFRARWFQTRATVFFCSAICWICFVNCVSWFPRHSFIYSFPFLWNLTTSSRSSKFELKVASWLDQTVNQFWNIARNISKLPSKEHPIWLKYNITI